MSALDDLFSRLRREGRKALIPFVTAGDPDLDFTEQVLMRLDRCGSSLCELGFPYSDPIADGPVIQTSYTRALERGVRVTSILESIASVAPRLSIPLVGMVSYAIVHRWGPARFVDKAQAAGLCGIIVPDLLVEECDCLAGICNDRDFSLIQQVTPTTPRDRAIRIAQRSTGFLYYVSVTGITGERDRLPAELAESVRRLRAQTDLPICVGFGISDPEHIRQLREVADGFIVGSAIVRRIAQVSTGARESALTSLEQFVQQLAAAT